VRGACSFHLIHTCACHIKTPLLFSRDYNSSAAPLRELDVESQKRPITALTDLHLNIN
jgi:hypothetical protein